MVTSISSGQLMNTVVYQLKVTLRNSRPPIWRRVEVPAAITLYQLHQLLQDVMGWGGGHLHQFGRGQVYYGQPDRELGFHRENERRVRLRDVLVAPKDRMVYEYDFGDGWEHDVVLERVSRAAADVHYPRVVSGKRHCPPEDVGGIWGYARFCEAMADGRHPEHAEYLEWYGHTFDPEEFDLEAANLFLQPRAPRRAGRLTRQ